MPIDAEILKTLQTVVPTRGCVEIRGQNLKGFWWSGFYDCNHFEKLAHDAVVIDQMSKGIYLTLNSTNPALLARRANRIETYGIKSSEMTSDKDITNWDYLPVDVDPKRPAGISSTDSELNAAREVAERVAAYLSEHRFEKPLIACSGNGYHLLYRIDLPRGEENDKVVKKILYALAAKFDTDSVGVDVSNNNPSRIFKLYGTSARKGENTPERPHRMSKIVTVPAPFNVVAADVLFDFISKHEGSTGKIEKKKSQKLKNPKDVTARHPELLKLVGKMVNDNLPFDAIQAACEKLNAAFPEPKPADVLIPEITKIYDFCIERSKELDKLPDYIVPVIDEETGAIVKLVIHYAKYAKFLHRKFNVVNFTGTLYIYDEANTVYKTNLNEIGTHVRDTYEEYNITERIVTVHREITEHLKNMGNEPEYPFDMGDGIILVQNCALRIADGKIEKLEHSPKIRKTTKLPVIYDPTADTAPVLAVLNQWVEDGDVCLLSQIPAQALYQMAKRVTLKRNYLLQAAQ